MIHTVVVGVVTVVMRRTMGVTVTAAVLATVAMAMEAMVTAAMVTGAMITAATTTTDANSRSLSASASDLKMSASDFNASGRMSTEHLLRHRHRHPAKYLNGALQDLARVSENAHRMSADVVAAICGCQVV